MKILFISNQTQSLFNSWSVLMKVMQEQGHEVVCLVPGGGEVFYNEEWQKRNIRLILYPLGRKGVNALQDIRTIFCLYKIIKKENPHKIFTYAIKPNIYGNIAACFAKKKEIYSCISGLGYCFEEASSWRKNLIQKIATSLYKIALRNTNGVIFQNNSDKGVFEQRNLLSNPTRTLVCNGTGVDLERFAYNKNYPKIPTFLLVARLLKAKGIEDYVKAAKILKHDYSQLRFLLLGPAEQGPGALSIKDVMSWHNAAYLEYLGACNDVRPHISTSSVVVLPSWREGLACALMEGMSMGRAVIASNVPGCKDLVTHEENGFLVPAKDARALANAMKRFIVEPELIKTMGLRARQSMQNSYDANKVSKKIIKFMNL